MANLRCLAATSADGMIQATIIVAANGDMACVFAAS